MNSATSDSELTWPQRHPMCFVALFVLPTYLAAVGIALWQHNLDIFWIATFVYVFQWAWFGLGVAAGEQKGRTYGR